MDFGITCQIVFNQGLSDFILNEPDNELPQNNKLIKNNKSKPKKRKGGNKRLGK